MERDYSIGQAVIFVDARGIRHNALVTIWWGAGKDAASYPAYVSASGEPGCNVVFVAGDESKDDPYGRQIERETSVVHRSKQPAHGMYWCWPNE